jgi:hypothetical protein
MERLLAQYINDKRLFKCALLKGGRSVNITTGIERGHFGAGYYSEGEVLLKKRPLLRELATEEIFSEIKSNFLLLSYKKDVSDTFRTENTQPFRFRNWLSAVSSDFTPQESFFSTVSEYIPEYIYKNLKSRRWEEYFFHLFLAYLHDKNKLDSLFLSEENLFEAVEFSIVLLSRLFQVQNVASLPSIAWAITNGDVLVAVTTGQGIGSILEIAGIEKCCICSDEKGTPYHDPKIISHNHLRSFFISCGSKVEDPRYVPMKPFNIVIISSEGSRKDISLSKL